MLKQHGSENDDAANARVTASEFAQAVAALQARQEEATHHTKGTVPISQAVQELHLDVTPEQVWAEVQAQRATRTPPRCPRWRPHRLVTSAALCLTLFAGCLGYILHATPVDGSAAMEAQETRQTWAQTQREILVLDHHQTLPEVRALSEMPDNREVECTGDAINAAVEHEWAVIGEHAPVDNQTERMTWPVLKRAHHLYVRGWTRDRMSDTAIRAGGVVVYNTPTAPALGSHPVQISVRITPGTPFSPWYGSQPYSASQDHSWESWAFTPAGTDEHTWEKW